MPKPVIATITLPLVSTRDFTPSSKHVIGSQTTTVNLQLSTDAGIDYSSYVVILETVDGHQVWHGNAVRGLGIVSAAVPAQKLAAGDYIVTLKGRQKNSVVETLNDYTLSIDRH